MNGWEEYYLSELVTFSQGIQIPVKKQNKEQLNGTVRFVRIVDFTTPDEVPRYITKPSDKYFVNKTDVVMIRYGWAGKVVRGIEGYIANNMFKISTKNTLLNKEFLYYFLSQEHIYSYLKNCNSSTTMPSIKFGDFDKIKINLPIRDTQDKIVEILNTFEKKIQLNTETNQTLENIAQAIFKSWFIDFDPVHAKANALANGDDIQTANRKAMMTLSGKTDTELTEMAQQSPTEYTQLHQTAQAFPSEFGENGLPLGWENIKIENIVKRLKNPKKLNKSDIVEQGRTLVLEQGMNIFMGYNNDRPAFSPTAENPIFIFGDHTCITHISTQPFSIYQNVIALTGQNLPTYWVYLAIQGKQAFQEYRRHWKELIVKEVIVPNNKLLCEVFSEKVKYFYQRIDSNYQENRILKQTRDTLLPKLLNGEIEL